MDLSRYTTLIEEIEKGSILIDEFNVIVESQDIEVVKKYLKSKGFYEKSKNNTAKFLIIGRKESVKADYALFQNGSKIVKVIEKSWNLNKMLRGE